MNELWLCIGGKPHEYVPTGDGYHQWISNGTHDTQPPADAPYYAEMKCAFCGATTHRLAAT